MDTVTLTLSTYDTVMLSIVAITISIFFLLGIALTICMIVLVAKIRKVAKKAEEAIDSVEAASEAIKHISAEATGPFALLKVVKSIIDFTSKRGK